MWIKIPLFISLWVGFLFIKIPTIILGITIIPYIYKYRQVEYDTFMEKYPGFRPWVNPEDWEGGYRTYRNSLPRWWVNSKGDGFKSFWHYHAIRNPANGLRGVEWLDLDIKPEEVKFKTNTDIRYYEPNTVRANEEKTVWYLAWQGWQAGFKLIHIWSEERHLVIKFGWRVEPSDATEETVSDMGIEDASFASKILPYRKG